MLILVGWRAGGEGYVPFCSFSAGGEKVQVFEGET